MVCFALVRRTKVVLRGISGCDMCHYEILRRRTADSSCRSLRSLVGMTTVRVPSVVRSFRGNRGPRRRGWLGVGPGGAKLRGIVLGACVWLGGGDRSGAWVRASRLLRG